MVELRGIFCSESIEFRFSLFRCTRIRILFFLLNFSYKEIFFSILPLEILVSKESCFSFDSLDFHDSDKKHAFS